MSEKDEIELDDFDLDDFNFDEFDIDPTPENDDRSPTAVIKDSALEGFRATLTDKDAVRRVLEKSLPKEYESTFEAISAAGDAKEQIKDAMEPVAKQAKGLARQNKALLGKFLPKKMAERLENWSDSDVDSGGYENIDPRAAEVGATLADIFRLNQERDVEAREVDKDSETERFAIKEKAETKRHMGQLEALEAIRSGISRQTDYQDQVLTRYQQKHLELTYKQLYTSQDILALGKRRAEADSEALASIVKNTSLPETQKIKAYEEAKRELSADIRREAVEGAGGYVRNLGGKMLGNTINTVKDRLQSTMSTVSDMTGMTEGGGMSPMDMIGSLLGTSVAESAMEKGLKAALKSMGQDADESRVKRLGARLALMVQESPEKLLTWSQSSSGRGGLGGFLEKFVKDQIPTFGRESKINIEQIADADEAATFSNRVARSITDVIPGYLSLQLHQLRLLVSDGEPIDKIEYNPETGRFGASKDRGETVHRRLFGASKDRYQRSLGEAADSLLGGAEVTEDQRAELENYLYDQLSRGKTAEISQLAKGIGRSDYVQESNKSLLSDILTKNVYDSTGQHYQSATVQNATRETYNKLGHLRDSVPHLSEEIDKLINAGYREDLIAMGLIDETGRIDHDVAAEHLGGRLIAKRGKNGTFQNRVASGHRDMSDGADLVGGGVQNTHPNVEERRTAALQETSAQRAQKEDPYVEDILHRINSTLTDNGEIYALRLSQLTQGQITQTEKLERLSHTLSTPQSQSQLSHSTDLADIRQAIEDCCIKSDAQEQTELLKQILAIIPESAMVGGPATDKSENLMSSIANRVGRVSKAASDGLQTYYKSVFGLAGKVVEHGAGAIRPLSEGAGGLLRSIGDRLTAAKGKTGKLYVKGRAEAVLHMNKLRAGEYIDGLTGKPIYTLEELRAAKGEIKNKAGEVILTVEDLAKGVYDEYGESIVTKGKNFLKAYYSALWGGTKGLAGMIPPAVRTAATFIKDIATRQKDIYVKGEDSPRILATLLKRGHYRSQKTGKPIYTYAEIDSSVLNPDGRVVLAMDELEQVVGPDGQPIRTLTEKGADLVRAYYSTLWRGTKAAGRFVGDLAGGLKNKLLGKSRVLGSSDEGMSEQTQSYWEEQLQILRRIEGYMSPGQVGQPSAGTLALPAPSAPRTDADFTPEPDLGPASRGADVVGTMTEKVSGAVGSLKDSFTKYFTRSKQDEEEHNQDRDQQTGLLSKLTSLTGTRADKLDDLQKTQAESQAQMTKTLKGIEENTEKKELRDGGWRERLAQDRSGESEDDDEPSLGKASKTINQDKKSMADVLLGPLGGIVDKFGEYMGMFGSAIAGFTGWIGTKLLGGAGADALGDAAGLADGRSSGRGARTAGRSRGWMGKIWSGAKSVVKKGGKAVLRAAPLALPYLATAAGAVGSGIAAVGSVLASPIVLGAAAVAGIAYGGYKLYQYAKSYTPQVLDKLRYAHYGLTIESEENRKLVMSLEAYLEDVVSWDNGTPRITPDPKDDTLAKILGLTGESEHMDPQLAAVWFRDRFLPVWSTHRAILKNQYDDEVTLSEIDDLKTHQKEAYLTALSSSIPAAMVSNMTGPFRDEPLEFTHDQVNAMHAWAADTLSKSKQPRRGPMSLGQRRPKATGGASIPGQDAAAGSVRAPGVRAPSPQGSGLTGRTGSSWGGFDKNTARGIAAKSNASTKYILSIKRHKETAQSTISDAALIEKVTGDKVFEFKLLERPGPDTKEPNQRLRIPEGSYKLKWQHQTGIAGVRPHLPVPWLYGNGVADSRHIYIHNGNYPRQTDGCLLCGKDESPNTVTSSVDTLDRLKTELMATGIENVTVEVSSAYKGRRVPMDSVLPEVAKEEWTPEAVLAREYSSDTPAPDVTGGAPVSTSPIRRPESASQRDRDVLRSMPKEWITQADKDAVEASVESQHPDKSERQRRTLKDIELTRLANQRQSEWIERQGVSPTAVKEVADTASPVVRRYATHSDTPTKTPHRPTAPALVEKPVREPPSRSLDATAEKAQHEQREAEERAQTQTVAREQSNLTQRVDKERRHVQETASRIESVLGASLATQQHMSDNLDKLVLLAEGRFQQETDSSPSEYLVKRGYRPPQGKKEAFKSIVDLSS